MTPATLHAARQVLPAWVVWAPLLAPLLAVPVTVALVWIAALLGGGVRRLAPDAHWTERARRLHVARRTRAAAIALAVLATVPLAIGGPVSIGAGLGRALAAVLAVGTGLALLYRFEDRSVRRIPAAARLRSLAAFVLVAAPGYLALGIGVLIPGVFVSAPGLLGYAVVVIAGALGGGALLARGLGVVRPAPERLRAALSRVAPSGPPPRLWALRVLHANVFTLQPPGVVLVTDGALDNLDDEQLDAVLAHELARLREPLLARVWTAAMAALPPLGVAVVWAIGAGRSFGVRILVADVGLVALFVLLRLHQRVRRAMQARSGAAGAAAAGPALAGALEAMYRANLSPAVFRRRPLGGDLVDRLAAAGATPDWPRPAPPPPLRPPVLGVVLAAALAFGAGFLARYAWSASSLEEPAGLRAVAVSGRAGALATLGWSRCLAGRYAQGLPLLRAARELEPRQPSWPTWEALAFARTGRCSEARSSLEAAQDLARDQAGMEGLVSVREAVAECTPR